jgi:hypothetical protein
MRHSPEDTLDVPNPAIPHGERDLYLILGLIGLGVIGVTNGIVLLILPEPSHWWHVLPAAVLIVAALGPWLGAYSLTRARLRTQARARARHADVFRRRHADPARGRY